MQEHKNLRNDYTTSQNLSYWFFHKVVYLSVFFDWPYENLTTVQDDIWNYFIIFTSKNTKTCGMTTQHRRICYFQFLTRYFTWKKFIDWPFENLTTVRDDNWNYSMFFLLQEYKNLRNDFTTSQNLSFRIYYKEVYLKIFINSPFINLPTVQDDNWNHFVIFLSQEYKNLWKDYTSSQNLSFQIPHKEVCLSIFIDLPFENLTFVQDDNQNNFIIS